MSENHRLPRRRRAAILVCVLVVLLLVGLLFTQTIQTLLIVRRSDAQRSELRQTRELVKLGQLVIAANNIPEGGLVELLVDGRKATISIATLEPPASFPDISNENTTFETTAVSEVDVVPLARYRIVANYSASQSREVTATWETPK